MRLLYILLYSAALVSSANADFQMFSSEDGTFIFDDKTGAVMKHKAIDPFLVDGVKHKSAFTQVIFVDTSKEKDVQVFKNASQALEFSLSK